VFVPTRIMHFTVAPCLCDYKYINLTGSSIYESDKKIHSQRLVGCLSNIGKHGDTLITVKLLIHFVLLLLSLLRYIFSAWYFVTDTMMTIALRYKLSRLSTVGNCVVVCFLNLCMYMEDGKIESCYRPVCAHVINKAVTFVNTKNKYFRNVRKIPTS
jgi:hypothetical protein